MNFSYSFLIVAVVSCALEEPIHKTDLLWSVTRDPEGDLITLDADKSIKFLIHSPQMVSKVNWCNSENGKRAVFVINQYLHSEKSSEKTFYEFKELMLIQKTENAIKDYKVMPLNTGRWNIKEVASVNNGPILKILVKATVRDSEKNKPIFQWLCLSWTEGYRALPSVEIFKLE